MLAPPGLLPQSATQCTFSIVSAEPFLAPVVADVVTGTLQISLAITASYAMPMTKQEQPSDATGARRAGILGDEQLAATVSAYLDGQLVGEDLAKFETLLNSDAALAREVQDLRHIELQLMNLGADILAEAIPDALIEAFKRVERA
jgi:hypothetical protein